MEERFLDLIAKTNGFDIVLSFIDFEDHRIGGIGNKVWYYVMKKQSKELWIGELNGDKWSDKHFVKKKDLVEESAESGTTISKVVQRLYFKQDEIEATGRKPASIEKHGQKCNHYVFSFGERAYDILDEYGVTCSYSNVNDISVGHDFRDVYVGKEVEVPKIK